MQDKDKSSKKIKPFILTFSLIAVLAVGGAFSFFSGVSNVSNSTNEEYALQEIGNSQEDNTPSASAENNEGNENKENSATVATLSHTSSAQNTSQASVTVSSLDSSAPVGEQNRVMLTVGNDVPVSDVYSILEKSGVDVSSLSMVSDSLYDDKCLLLLEYSSDQDESTVCDTLTSSGIASEAEPDAMMTLADIDEEPTPINGADADLKTTSVNDYFVSLQWGLDSVGAYDAWDKSEANGGVTVAVIDSGVDYDHPDLVNNLILDYAKDTYNETTGGEAVDDENGHGTHVAGIIAAEANNSIGVAGVSYNAKVLPIQASCDSEGHLYTSDIIEGIAYVIDLKESAETQALANIRVINMSLGGTTSYSLFQDVIDAANDAGILVVAAAGNESTSTPSYPAAYDGVVGVSALEYSDGTPGVFDDDYSNYGSYVDISAPGTTIASTYKEGQYVYLSGTSMATPMVSGCAALLYAQNMSYEPSEVEGILESSTTDLGNSGRDDLYGYGAVNIASALSSTSEEGETGVGYITVTSDDLTEGVGSAQMGVWVDADDDDRGRPAVTGSVSGDSGDVIQGTWSVTIPDMVALEPAAGTTKGQPGTYTGSAIVSYGGDIGTAQTLTVVPAATFTMKDSKKWSADVYASASVAPGALTNLSYAQVQTTGSAAVNVSAELDAGSWSGIESFTIYLAS